MNNLVCHYSPKGGLDDRISKIFTDYSKEDIGALRALYDMDHEKPLVIIPEGANEAKLFTGSELLEIADKLFKYEEKLNDKHLQELKDSTKHVARTFNKLYQVEGWDEATRRNRINMVATEFTAEVTKRMKRYAKQGISISREEIIAGRKRDGVKYDGQFSIFEAVFNKFLQDFKDAMAILEDYNSLSEEEKDTLTQDDISDIAWAEKRMEELPKIFKNWSALCTFARMSLRDTESLKLGATLEYASPVSPDNLTLADPLENTYDLEESVREAWMTHVSETSAFGSLGAEVRRFLSTIPEVDAEGNVVKDDMGYYIKMDPISTHRYLADILRGVTTESKLIKKLHTLSENDAKINAIFKALGKAAVADLTKDISDLNKPQNPVIITQLLLDMHKNLVPFTAVKRMKNGLRDLYIRLLNRQENPLTDEFSLRIGANIVLDETNSVYDKEGNVDWVKLASWYKEVQEMFPEKKQSEESGNNLFTGRTSYGGTNKEDGFWGNKMSKTDRLSYMSRAAKALGIPLDLEAAKKLYNDPLHRKPFLDALYDFGYTVRGAIGSDARRSFDTLVETIGKETLTDEERSNRQKAIALLEKSFKKYKDLLSKDYGGTKITGLEKIKKVLDNTAEVTVNLRTERSVSWYDRKGKANRRFSDQTPSYMGDLVDKIHEFVTEGDGKGLRAFIEDKWGRSSFFVKSREGGKLTFYNRWLQELYDSIDEHGRFDKEAMAKVFSFDEFLGSDVDGRVVTFENFTEKQHAEAMLLQFLQPRQDSFKSKLAKYPCFILGDSGTQRFFTAHHYNINTIISGLIDVAQQERERVKYVKATNEVLLKDFAKKNGYKFEDLQSKSLDELSKLGFRPIENFSQTAEEFTMLRFLNSDFKEGKYWKILTGNNNMTNRSGKSLTKAEAMQEALESLDNQSLQDAIVEYMKDALAEFKHKLATVGILTEIKGEGGVIRYVDANNQFHNKLSNYKNGLDGMLEDFFWNTKYATIQQLQLFTVDPAFYDHRYPVKDLQKRYKEIYAPGKGLSLEARNISTGELYMTRPYERVAYFDDISVSSKDVNPYFFELMQKTFGEDSPVVKSYTKNTLTDGQGYRTLESYRAVKGMAGEWSMAMEDAYNRIQEIRNSGRELTEDDIKELAQLAVVMQPIKPYFYGLEKLQINDEGDVALIPVQHKYAEIVLIPELMQEGKLKDMAIWMENHVDEGGNAAPIDLVASTKCVKVGAFGSVNFKGVNTTEAINETLNKAFIHNLPWSDYRIQSGVPEHLNHAQLFGTQIRKLILAGIKKGNPYNYLSNIFGKVDDPLGPKFRLPGVDKTVHLTGNNLIALYNSLIMANLFDSYNEFAAKVGTNKSISDLLVQNVIANSNQAEDNAFGYSLIDDGEFLDELLVPLGEPGSEHDAVALLWSLFKKFVNKQRIKGGSAVQASAMGLSRYDDSGNLFEVVSPEGDNVLYDEIEMPWNLSYTSATGKDVPLNFNDWCNPDGTLKMSDQIVYGEDAREYLSWPVSGRDNYGKPNQADENGYDPNGYYVPLIETKYKGILDIIAYRIPTERDYSTINCKVYRFTNPLAGGVLKVPSSRTTTAGFDFDIDKLYFFMREFAQTKISKQQEADIWADIYGLKYNKEGHIVGGNEIYQALKEAQAADQRGSRQLDKLLGALTNSESASGIREANDKAGNLIKLHDYWESAGLEGTAEEAFNKYLVDHGITEFETYNPELSPLENTRVSRNNMLLDLIRQRLMDKETLSARYTPGGFESNREAALKMRILQYADPADITTNGKVDWGKVDKYVKDIRDGIRKDPEPEYDPSDPTAILVYNQQNQIAGKLIGIFANQNTNHAYASTLSVFALAEPIKLGEHTKMGLWDFLKGPKGIDVDTNVAEYLAASVDAVKDPVLNFINLNTLTADAGAVLARIGYTPQEIGLFFNQPIIKDVCTYAANHGVKADTAILETLNSKKWGGSRTRMEDIQVVDANMTSEALADNIVNSRDENISTQSDFRAKQLQVLKLFNQLLEATADVNSFVQCTRFTAANFIGSTEGDLIAKQDRVKKFAAKYSEKSTQTVGDTEITGRDESAKLIFELVDKEYAVSRRFLSANEANIHGKKPGIINDADYLMDLSPEEYMAQMAGNPLAFEQCMFDLTRKATKKLFSKHFPYYTELYSNMRDAMRGLTQYYTLNADLIDSLHRELFVYLLSKQEDSAFNGESEAWVGNGVTNRQYYTMWFPSVFYDLKNEGLLASVPFFNVLTVTGERDSESRPLAISVPGMGGLQAVTSNSISEMWAQAYNSKEILHSEVYGDIPVKQLAEDLYFYNFYKLGYNFHPTTFMSLAPTLLKLGLKINTASKEGSYIEFIRDIIEGRITLDAANMTSFAKQYILNHLDNKMLVYTPTAKAKTTAKAKAWNAKEEGWNTSFTLSVDELGAYAKLFTIPNPNLKSKLKAFKPVIAFESEGGTVYYMANSNSIHGFNVVDSANGCVEYKLVTPQGERGKQLQYFGNAVSTSFQRKARQNINNGVPQQQITSEEQTPVEESPVESPVTDGVSDSFDFDADPVALETQSRQERIREMFDEEEWAAFTDTLRMLFPMTTLGVADNSLIQYIVGNNSTHTTMDTIMDIANKLKHGEKFTTINEDGKEITVC